jgi:pyruvate/2-oxoglutarate dehydrogenase complex dihydrolipoamide dehydrogenase (E3) component
MFIRRETFLRTFDTETVAVVRAEMESMGCKVHPNTLIGSVEKKEDGTLSVISKSGSIYFM